MGSTERFNKEDVNLLLKEPSVPSALLPERSLQQLHGLEDRSVQHLHRILPAR